MLKKNICIVKVTLVLPSLVAHTPSVAFAALLPHLHHAGNSLHARLMAPQHRHLLVSADIWPVHGETQKWTDALFTKKHISMNCTAVCCK